MRSLSWQTSHLYSSVYLKIYWRYSYNTMKTVNVWLIRMSDSSVTVSKALFFPFILLHHLEATCSSDNAFLNVYDSVFQPGIRGTPGFREWPPAVPPKQTEIAWEIRLLQKVRQTLGSLHRVPWATQTFAEGSAAARGLKNTCLLHTQVTRGNLNKATSFHAMIKHVLCATMYRNTQLKSVTAGIVKIWFTCSKIYLIIQRTTALTR